MNKKPAKFLMRKVLFLSAIFFISFSYSCKKEGKLSPDFDNGNLSILFTDTFSLNTSVILEDSLRTDLSIYNLLGLYHDPIFGPVSSSIYSQVILSGTSLNFGATSVFDSIVLTLDYQGLYGDTASPMTLNVYELNNDLLSTTDYYSSTYTAFKSPAIGSLTFTPNLADSVTLAYNNVTLKPHLRIKLNNTFGQNIFNADTLSDLASNSGFTNFMKGIYITTNDSVTNTSIVSGSGSMAYIDMNSSLSTLTIYYNDTSAYSFTISSEAKKYARFAHNYAGTDVIKHVAPVDPTVDTTLTYVSTMAGVRTKITLPTIKDLANDGPVIINKAELVLTIENGTGGNFDDALESISLVGIDASGSTTFLPDFYEGVDHYGGVKDANTNTYTFNISRHLNDLVNSTATDYGMYLIANGASISTNRVVLGSEKNPISKIKLNITYSKL